LTKEQGAKVTRLATMNDIPLARLEVAVGFGRHPAMYGTPAHTRHRHQTVGLLA